MLALRHENMLRATQTELARCIVEHRKELGHQRELLKKQDEILGRLVNNRVKIDFVIDVW